MIYSDFKCTIDIKKNPLNLNINDYLEVALRDNPKRRFLFVSKTLGKHLPVNPKKVDELGKNLSYAYKKKYKNYIHERQMVIGFAETATCLAHSFFNYIESAEFFIHTTRENVCGAKKLEFLEEHSHATEQNLYIDNLNEDDINSVDSIILVDDEITTAKTCINMIRQMQKIYNVKKYVIASILNWIDEERKAEIESQAMEMGCDISFVYLFNGSFNFSMDKDILLTDKIEKVEKINNDVEINNIKLDFSNYIGEKKYIKYTGRFGIGRSEQNELLRIIERESKKLKIKYDNAPILTLGIEEFMYIPMLLSKKIQGDVYYHSITRSPIIPRDIEGYPIKKKYMLESFYNKNTNFIYNLNANKYKECFLFMEIEKDNKKINEFIEILKSVGIKRINIIRC